MQEIEIDNTKMQINSAHPKFQDVSIAPMHTAEHILNRTMVNMFGCNRSHNAHIERKKSKCDYYLPQAPTAEQMQAVEDKVNEVIASNLEVYTKLVPRSEVDPAEVDLNKLPTGVSDTLRLVYVGDYDVCACVGTHVENTSEIGTFKIISSDYSADTSVLRIRFKLV